jgi:hypothetical protein
MQDKTKPKPNALAARLELRVFVEELQLGQLGDGAQPLVLLG